MNTFLFTPFRYDDGYYRIPMNSITCDKEWFHHPDLASGSLLYLVDQLNSCLCMVGDWSVEGDHIRLNTDVTGVIRMPFKIPSPSSLPDNTVPLEVAGLVISRNEARKNKDFKRSDELRKCIEGHGWSVKDTPKGATLKRIIP